MGNYIFFKTYNAIFDQKNVKNPLENHHYDNDCLKHDK